MKIPSKPRTVEIAGASLEIGRTAGGVVEIHGRNHLDLMRGLGFAHTCDRLTQMSLVRLVGQGRLCECLDDSEQSLAIDVFMHQLGFAPLAQVEAQRCTPEGAEFVAAYAEGVNHGLRAVGRPWGLRFAGLKPEPWEPADSLLTILLMSYVGLAQTQQDLEKFLIQAIQAGVDRARLAELFSPHLDGLTDALVDLIAKVHIVEPIVPSFHGLVPSFTASNNWAIAPSKSATGHALECHDPHLECNRLPAVWYEVVLCTPDDYQIGVTMPGVPGLIMGRTKNVSVGFTYGFMDMVDYFIEECREGRYRRDDGWRPFCVRRETILRKRHATVEIDIYENEHGTLEADPFATAHPGGHYLCRALAFAQGGSARSLHALARWPQAKTVAEAQCVLRDVTISANWVLADRAGNIGYQQSGLLPRRAHSGLLPVAGWDRKSAWQGIVPSDQLASRLNPPEGFIVTANDDWNQPGGPVAINACQGPYRAERIREFLSAKEKLSIADMQALQADLYSIQARRFMVELEPLLPATEAGRELREWNLCYDRQSRAASRFEAFYHELLGEVLGNSLFGLETWDSVISSTNLLGIYFYPFDQVLLSGNTSGSTRWFRGRSRAEIFRDSLERAFADNGTAAEPWGRQRQVVLRNLLLGSRLPAWISRQLGINRGPVVLAGNRSTVVQGAIFRSHGRLSTIAPSYRAVTDMGTDEVRTALAGGPSERVFSPWYAADLHRWLAFDYKLLRGIASRLISMR